jgi:hypothetical protein
VGLGRTTRFAALPAGARRVSVMRAGAGGLKVLAPSAALLRDFLAAKRALVRQGMAPDAAHAAAHRRLGYRERYLAELRARSGAIAALRGLLDEARTRDVYLMCMCPYRTRGRACHTYALLDLARSLDPRLRRLPEPVPRGQARAATEPAPASPYSQNPSRRATGRKGGRTPPARRRSRGATRPA